jgi:hypothetical protein
MRENGTTWRDEKYGYAKSIKELASGKELRTHGTINEK